MSSILEALRELEGERPPASRRPIPPPEPPRATRRAVGAFIPVLGGLAVGVVVFGIWALGPKLVPPPAAPVAGAGAVAEPATTEPPTWLDTAEPPRARVNRGAAPATAPVAAERPAAERPAAAPARRPVDAPADEAAVPRREEADEPRPATSGGQVVVESISYSENGGARVATIRYHGRRVTLRQRETVGDIEVQLIMPNGVYVQRGGEVYLLPVAR